MIISGFKHWQACLKDKHTTEWISDCLTSEAAPPLTSKDYGNMKGSKAAKFCLNQTGNQSSDLLF